MHHFPSVKRVADGWRNCEELHRQEIHERTLRCTAARAADATCMLHAGPAERLLRRAGCALCSIPNDAFTMSSFDNFPPRNEVAPTNNRFRGRSLTLCARCGRPPARHHPLATGARCPGRSHADVVSTVRPVPLLLSFNGCDPV